MNQRADLRRVIQVALVLTLALAAAAECGGLSATAADTKSAGKLKPAKKLTGAELYAIHCNRCHPERYPTEFNSDQWQTLLIHMRVRANLPAKQAREILKYLQEEFGN